jgi:NAD(P)-dependent dehydrogenase (short-subunit alcohol dehydrogenase family)
MNRQIRVNGLIIRPHGHPGRERIIKVFHGADDGWLQRAEAQQPFGRRLKPDEVARAVAFLASAGSGLMTGSIIDFDQQVLAPATARSRCRRRDCPILSP